MALDPQSRVRFNLSDAAILLLDGTPLGMSILVQMISGFGAKTLFRCATALEAREMFNKEQVDLAIIDALAPSGHGYDLVHWLRRSGPELNRYTPVIVTEGHTRISDVERARDCGANFLLKRPLSSMALLERIVWVSKEGRGYVIDDSYVGPDRRFKSRVMPQGEGRRAQDREGPVEVEDETGDPSQVAGGQPLTSFVFPKNRLSKLLKAAGGKPVTEALDDADTNLATLQDDAAAELKVMLRDVEAGFAALGDVFDGDKLDALYLTVNRAIGVAGVCGLHAVDTALVSLCQLLDYLKASGKWDKTSVAVHVQALRLLLAADPKDAQVAEILDGLKRVSALYAAPAQG